MKYLVRISPDLTLKSHRIRARFMARLVHNLHEAFKTLSLNVHVERQWSRLFVTCDDPLVEVALGHVFGIASWSLVEFESHPQLAAIVEAGQSAYQAKVANRTFAVRARRTGQHEFSSLDVARALGAALAPASGGVDLRTPDIEVHVEVREDRVYFFSGETKGPGGLPLGVSGQVVCLLSGGFDSAVAAWLMQKRGVSVDFLFCNVADRSYERAVVTLAQWLDRTWGHGVAARLHIVDFREVVNEIRRVAKPAYAQVVLKRMFYRVAQEVAAETGASAIVTGECIGQVSSQTLANLGAIEAVSDRPVLRPVIGFDKEEIIALARRIGSFSFSAGVQEYCQLVPDKPVTASSGAAADRQEEGFDTDLLKQALSARRVVVLKDLEPADLVMPYVHVATIPAGATVIDCRPRAAYAAWHWPGALPLEVHEVGAPGALERSRTYVLYCAAGLASAVAAEELQRKGFQAYSIKGGVKTLRELSV